MINKWQGQPTTKKPAPAEDTSGAVLAAAPAEPSASSSSTPAPDRTTALRTLLKAISGKKHRRYVLEIIEPQRP